MPCPKSHAPLPHPQEPADAHRHVQHASARPHLVHRGDRVIGFAAHVEVHRGTPGRGFGRTGRGMRGGVPVRARSGRCGRAHRTAPRGRAAGGAALHRIRSCGSGCGGAPATDRGARARLCAARRGGACGGADAGARSTHPARLEPHPQPGFSPAGPDGQWPARAHRGHRGHRAHRHRHRHHPAWVRLPCGGQRSAARTAVRGDWRALHLAARVAAGVGHRVAALRADAAHASSDRPRGAHPPSPRRHAGEHQPRTRGGHQRGDSGAA